MTHSITPGSDTDEQDRADFRTRRVDGGWLVDGWTPRGWETLPGTHSTKRDAIESTRPPGPFCERHWSWLCGHNCAAR